MKKEKNLRKADVIDVPAKPIETLGEAFADGVFVEPVHDPIDGDRLRLMLWDGESAEIASIVQHENRAYMARAIDPSIVHELHLPTKFRPNEPVPELLADVVRLIQRFTGLPDKPAKLVARFTLATWVMEALPAAPSVVFVGPDSRELMQLLNSLKCLCRHALLLTEVTAGGICSLPMELSLTLLIDQPQLSEPVEHILNASRKREKKLPRRGRLWQPFCAKAVHYEGYFHPSIIGALKISVNPIGRPLPILDDRERTRIASEFQPRLLSYRVANFRKVRASEFDSSISDYPTRETVNSLAACTPENVNLHAEILELIADQAAEVRQEKWTDPAVVLIEALLLLCHTPKEGSRPYVGEVTEAMKTIFSARGEERDLQSNQVSKMIRYLGLKLEPRDSQGVKILLTESVRRRIHELAQQFAVPSIDNRVVGCLHCTALPQNAEPSTVMGSPAESE
ncbi:MAG: hypothetical protein WBL70_17760 [Candidatus Acidiferrales bacterium]